MLALADQLLARQDFDDWIQIIIVVLVLAGSAIGGLSKKLMEAFGRQNADESEESEEKPRRVRRHAFPPARPMPSHGAPDMTGDVGSPTARPVPSVPQAPTAPPVVARIGGIEVVIHRPAPQVGADRPPPARPARPLRPGETAGQRPSRRTATPTGRKLESARPVRRSVPTERTHSTPPAPPPPKPVMGHLGSLEETVEGHLGHLEPTVSRHLSQFDAGVQQHLGEFRPRVGVDPADLTAGASLGGSDISTLAGLRRAVILSEILGLPVGLRDQRAI